MSDDIGSVLFNAGLLILAGALFGFLLTAYVSGAHYRAAAIEQGCAAYDTTTGDWHWLETQP